MAGQSQPVAPAGGKITLLQPATAGAGHRRAEQAQAGEAFEPNHQVQVLGPAVGEAAQGLEQLPLQDEDLVAIGQAQEAAAPVGRPGDPSEGRQGRGESQLKGAGGKGWIRRGPAQCCQMGGSQYGVGVQEGQEAAPGFACPGVHLAASAAGGPQAVDLGMAGRHFPGVVGAAAVHQDDLQVGRGRQPRQGRSQERCFVQHRQNDGYARIHRLTVVPALKKTLRQDFWLPS